MSSPTDAINALVDAIGKVWTDHIVPWVEAAVVEITRFASAFAVIVGERWAVEAGGIAESDIRKVEAHPHDPTVVRVTLYNHRRIDVPNAQVITWLAARLEWGRPPL